MKGEADLVQNYQNRFVEAVNSLKMLGESKEVTDEFRVPKIVRPKQ